MVDKFGTLYSDNKQTTQGRKIWADLAKFFPDIEVTDTGDRLQATKESIEEKSAVTTDLELDNIPDIDLNKALDIMAHDPETFNGQRLKDVFIMRYKNKMTFTEIGAEINTGTDRARQIYQRSLRKLRFLLKDYMSENFADGKVKGKSRPGRFKKAGVSCKGSVTDLRRKAKNASGEKQKGYHWCANMKSGRNK